jgi:hypothetical protein
MSELRQRQPKSTPSSTPKPRVQKEIVKGKKYPDQGKGHISAMNREDADDPRVPLLGLQGAKKDVAAALSELHSSTSPPSLPVAHEQGDAEGEKMENLSRKSQWIVLALASGACAAFNGVFAKL